MQRRAQRPPNEQEADEVDAILEKQRSDACAVLEALDNEACSTQFEINRLTNLDAELAVDEERKKITLALDCQCLQMRQMFKPN